MPLEIKKETSQEPKLVKGGKFHWYLYLLAFLAWGYSVEALASFRNIFLENLLLDFPSNMGKTKLFFTIWFVLIVLTVLFTELIFFIWKKISDIEGVGTRVFLSDFLSSIYVSTFIMFFYLELMCLPDYFFDNGYFSIAFLNENKTFSQLMGFIPLSGIAYYLIKTKGKEFIRIRTKIFFEQTVEN